MLTATFQHIPGVGETTEHMLWAKGITTWDAFLEKGPSLPLGRSRRLKAGVLESKARLARLDHSYFRDMLGGGLSWRAYDAFREHVCFLDIETTGLSPSHSEVTAVCVHSGEDTRSYVLGDNLGELKGDLKEFKYVVSFNGARFDLPFLTHALGIRFPQLHLDLMHPLRSLGYGGGLKNVEKRLGVSRDTDGVTGYDAVRLWRSYKSGRTVEVAGRRVKGDGALKLLVDYNREDTVNLEKLADWTVGELQKRAWANASRR